MQLVMHSKFEQIDLVVIVVYMSALGLLFIDSVKYDSVIALCYCCAIITRFWVGLVNENIILVLYQVCGSENLGKSRQICGNAKSYHMIPTSILDISCVCFPASQYD